MMRRCIAWAVLCLLPIFLDAQERLNRISSGVDHDVRTVLRGNVHPWAQAAYDRGPAPANLPMERMLLVLKRSPEQQKSLDQYLASVQDKDSPNYHHWLTPTEFGEKFGVYDGDLHTLESWLRSQGLAPAGVNRAKTVLEFSGSAAQVQKAFSTEVHSYNIGGRLYHANATDPEIPASLAGVVAGVASMHNFFTHGSAQIITRGNVRHHVESRSALTFYDESVLSHAVVPDDLQTIYNAKPLFMENDPITGRGQKIAVVARSNVNDYDIESFRSLFQPFAPQDRLRVLVNGVDPGVKNDEDTVEATANAEYAGALAPDAEIVLVVSASTNNTDGIALSALFAVDNNVAPVLTVSYGACEASLGTAYNQFYSSLWEQAAAQGMTVIVSSGDSGPAGCDLPSTTDGALASRGPAVNGLASTPFNIAVGGSQFRSAETNWSTDFNVAFGSAISQLPEIAWNESCTPNTCGVGHSTLWAGSGGPSSCTKSSVDAGGRRTCEGRYEKPVWQSSPGVPSDGARDLPDVALLSSSRNGYVICVQGSCSVDTDNGDFQFYVAGGTSMAAPAFAGAMALVNQKDASGQGQAAAMLYSMAATEFEAQCDPTSSSCAFTDVTEGHTDIPCAGGSPGCSESTVGSVGILKGHTAGAGYDMATGLGSINVANLVRKWMSPQRTPTTTTLQLGATNLVHGQTADVKITVNSQPLPRHATGDVVLLRNSPAPNSSSVLMGSLSDGELDVQLDQLPGGSYDLVARYSGDGFFESSVSPPVRVNVSPEASASKLEAFLETEQGLVLIGSTVPFGSRILLRTRVSGASGAGHATGTSTLKATPPNGETASLVLPLNNAGEAETRLLANSLGHHTIVADYSGDLSFEPSAAPTVLFEAVKGNVQLVASVENRAVRLTDIIQVHVLLKSTSVSPIQPSGLVTAALGDTKLQAAELNGFTDPETGFAFARAELNIPAFALSPGANTIVVGYGGDTFYHSALSPVPVSVLVAQPEPPAEQPVNISLSLSALDSVSNHDVVTLTAAVKTDSHPISGGTVTFFNHDLPIGTIQVVGKTPAAGFQTGTAILKATLPVGVADLWATYNGIGGRYARASSSHASRRISGSSPVTVTLTAASSSDDVSKYDLTASVLGGGAVAPSGKVVFSELTSGLSLASVAVTPSKPIVALVEDTSIAIDRQDVADDSVLASDLNNDGRVDVVTASRNDMSISVRLGTGDSIFDPPRQFHLNGGAVQLTAIDLNQDGYQDIAVATSAGVDVLLGRGDGTFDPALSTAVADSPRGIVTVDFTNDGIPDLAVYSGVSPYIFILVGTGGGTFLPAKTCLASEIVTGLAAADIDRNGTTDLVLSSTTGLSVLFGNADGTFRPSDSRPFDGRLNYFLSQLSSPTIADFNSDGVLDIAAIPEMLPHEVLLVLGNADGSFQPAKEIAPSGFTYFNTTISAKSLTVADLNADGKPDIIQMLSGTNSGKPLGTMFTYVSTGDGTFEEPVALTMPSWNTSSPKAEALADLDGDGLPDLLAITSSVESAALVSARLRTVSAATVHDYALGAPQTLQAGFLPDGTTPHSSGSSDPLILRVLEPTTSFLQYGYKNYHGGCSLGNTPSEDSRGSSSVPCFYVHVGSESEVPVTGSIRLEGTMPSGQVFESGPFTLYPDGSGGGYIYVFYNDGVGDAGMYSFRVFYLGDTSHHTNASEPIPVNIRSLPSSISLSAPQELLAGNIASVTGRVATPTSTVPMNGTVALYDGDNLAQESLIWTSSFGFSVPLTPGKHCLKARFSGVRGRYGDFNIAPAESSPITINVYEATPQSPGFLDLNVTSQSAFATPSFATVSVEGELPGTVTLLDGSTAVATSPLLKATASRAVVNFKVPLSVGQHVLKARYNGYSRLSDHASETFTPVYSEQKTVAITSAAPVEITLVANPASSATSGVAVDLFAYGSLSPEGTIVTRDQTTATELRQSAIHSTDTSTAFREGPSVPINGTASLLLVLDINDDGLQDLAVLDSANLSAHLLIAAGRGRYAPQQDYTLSGSPVSATSADVNCDGILDLVVATSNRHIDVLLGSSTGSFAPVVTTEIPFAASKVLAGDLNGDGLSDLVALGESSTTNMSVLMGNGDGTFKSATYTVPLLSPGHTGLIADLNSDYVPDLLIVTNGGATYRMLGVGDGSLQPATYLNAIDGRVAASDLNADGNTDLIFAPSVGKVAIELGRSDGSFTPPRYYSVSQQTTPDASDTAVSVADFNHDGFADIISAGILLLGRGDGSFVSEPTNSPTQFVDVADVNADGVPDLLGFDNNSVTVRYGGTAGRIAMDDLNVRGSGVHQVVATFVPDVNVPYATSSSSSISIAHETSAVELIVTQLKPQGRPVTYGDSAVLAVSVSSAEAGSRPTGQLVVAIDGHPSQSAIVAAGTTEFTLAALTGGSHTICVEYSGDKSFSPARQVMTILVQAAKVALNVNSSAPSTNSGAEVAITAELRGAAGGAEPSGAIQIRERSLIVADISVTGGIARYATSTLTAGIHHFEIVYSGDSNYSGATAVLEQSVIAPEFQLSAAPSALNILEGHSGSTTVNVSSIAGYRGTLQLQCGELPQSVQCTFSPSTVEIAPSGSAAATAMITVRQARTAQFQTAHGKLALLAIMFPTVVLSSLGGKKRRFWLGLIAGAFVVATSLTSCGGGSGSPSAPDSNTVTYKLRIAASDGQLIRTVQLIIQVR